MININADVEVEDLVEQVCQASRERIYELIKGIETHVCDADFTADIAAYFCEIACEAFDGDASFNPQNLLPKKYRR